MHPSTELGTQYWDTVYKEISREFSTKDILLNAFHKLWISPTKATVYEVEAGKDDSNMPEKMGLRKEDHSTIIIENYLEVLTETDHFALKHVGQADRPLEKTNSICHEVFTELIVPVIEHEINTGKAFSLLRQIYNCMLLATCYMLQT